MAPDGDPELAYGSLSIQQPLTSSGLSLFASASYSETRPGLELERLDTEGTAKSMRVELSYPIVRSRDLNVIGTVGFAASNVRSENAVVKPTFEDRLRSVKADVFVNALDSWGGSNSGQVTFTQGVTAFNGSKRSDGNLSRVNADSEFSRLNVEVSRWQPLWNEFGLLVGAAAQTSFNEDLLAGEEVGFGGTNYGRAFDPSEITGENGLAGKAEASWYIPHSSSIVQNPELYTFYEIATVDQVTLLPGEEERETIRSAGLGVRLGVAERANVNVYVAKPFGHDITAERDRDLRVFFSVSSSF
ncbi:ShlB/FhaC/HecB family hemolysin secretion/activation protein [Pyruvatibacter mobilis]|uniref:ShlB/FhaC/HecB family hemolysin secretion/activation protein n=1 Tax=Pyruvatibacter mobilis TaxID=1712261 RepID=UPI003BADA7ED